MKAKEYFEKYFADAKIENLESVLKSFISEMVTETIEMSKTRHSLSNKCIEGSVREMNQKYNSIADMCEKKFGEPVLTRNGFMSYCRSRFAAAGIVDADYDEKMKKLRGMRP